MKKQTQGGEATSDVVVSAYIDNNDVVFSNILDLYVPKGSKIADVTFGQGVLWNNVDINDYQIFASDLYLKEKIPAKFPDLNICNGT